MEVILEPEDLLCAYERAFATGACRVMVVWEDGGGDPASCRCSDETQSARTRALSRLLCRAALFL